MASREAIVRAVSELRTWFPTMPDAENLIEATRRGLEEYDDDEVRVAVQRITRERKRQQGAPALADLREMCAAVAGVRRAEVVRHQRADSSDAYCPLCGTRTLTWGPLWPNGRSRLVPLHERECVRFGVEELVSPPVNMARWPGAQPPRGGQAVALGDVVEEVAP